MKFRYILAVVLPLLVSCSSQQEKSMSDSEIYFSIAREYIAAGQPDKGLDELENAIKAFPDNFDAYFLKMETLALSGRFDEAFKTLDKVSMLLPPEMAYLKDHWRGVLHNHQNNLTEAAKFMEKSAAQNPDFADNYIVLGQVYTKLGVTDKAVDNYLRWTRLDPGSENAWSQLGMAYVSAKKFKEARRALEKSLSIKPENAVVYNYLGTWAMQQDKRKEAEGFMKKSLALDDSDPFANLNYAQLLMLQKRENEAYPYLKRSYELKKDYMSTLFWLAKYYVFAREYDMAVEHYVKALDMEPSFWPARIGIGDLALDTGRYLDVAEREMRNGLEKDPGNRKGYFYYLARIELARNRSQSALEYADKALPLIDKSNKGELADINRLRKQKSSFPMD